MQEIIAKLTSKDDKYACAIADKIVSESQETDEKPITERQCIKALAGVGLAKPQYIPKILSCLKHADLSKYKDSMRPLIEKGVYYIPKQTPLGPSTLNQSKVLDRILPAFTFLLKPRNIYCLRTFLSSIK
ncbi:MAG: hypothetical protein Q4C17_04260 [Bacillota bacterium]|nr:hypothetical protein [Bacillota bacterium]